MDGWAAALACPDTNHAAAAEALTLIAARVEWVHARRANPRPVGLGAAAPLRCQQQHHAGTCA
jgi:hypothetical protein